MALTLAALLLVVLAFCGRWFRGLRTPFKLLYLWSVYCTVAYVSFFGVHLLAFRWWLAGLSAVLGIYWFASAPRPRFDVTSLLALLLIVMAIFSTLYSRIPDYTLPRAGALLLIYAFVFLGVRSLLRTEDDLVQVAHGVIAGMAINIGLVLVGAGTEGIHLATDSYRFQSHLKATGVAHAICGAMPLVIWLARHPLRAQRWLLLALSLFLLYALVATRSRLGIIAFVVTAPLCLSALYFRQRLAGTLAVAATCWALGAGLWSILSTDDTRELLRMSDKEEVLRSRVDGRWDIIWERAAERPLFGWGYGTVRYGHIAGKIDWKFEDGRMDQIVTHNEHLGLFHDLGIGAVLLFWLYLGAVLAGGVRLLAQPSGPLRDLLLALWLSWLVDGLNTMSHDGLLTVGNPGATLFWIKGVLVCDGGRIFASGLRRIRAVAQPARLVSAAVAAPAGGPM